MSDTYIETLVVKYVFTYGPLMIFFFAVGWGIKSYGPPLVAAWTNLMRETVAALNSSSNAMFNSASAMDASTRALSANSEAMNKHHETVMVMQRFWEDMSKRLEKLENFNCPASIPNRNRGIAKKTQVRIVSSRAG